ncbi:peptidase S28 [Xylariaceae sp. FL0804]|nr:peptidase S28 [Xylariaceae sp. FL0804]
MVHYALLAGLIALASGAGALSRQPLPISELAKQIRGRNTISARQAQVQATYPEYNLSVPIDHFHNESMYEPHSDGKFNLRYWFDAQYYKPGGPVIVLESGEDDGTDRLIYLEQGIVYQLMKATGGVGVILEHRYYGTSFPTDNLTTESLRFLTTDQALADTAYFANNVEFEGLEDVDLKPETTPWIAYGGSYAGSFVAFLRKLYPDVYWGAISSSGVPEAIWDYWQYYEAAAVFGPPECVETTQKLTHVIDNILIGKQGTEYVAQLKEAFGLPNVTHDTDFASALTGGISGLQSYNWDPSQSSDSFFVYCSNVSSDSVLFPATEARRASVRELISVGGYKDELDTLTNRMLNYIGYVNETSVSLCTGSQDGCYSTYDESFYEQTDISQTWRSWPYQYCTQWGFLQTGSGVPADQLPLISRTIDLEYTSLICREAFNLTSPADVGAINKYGGWGIAYERLASINGQWDPWRAAGTHALGRPTRPSTTGQPFVLIDRGVHHWDENGVLPNQTRPGLNFPPAPVAGTQAQEAAFVRAWVAEFYEQKKGKQQQQREQEEETGK